MDLHYNQNQDIQQFTVKEPMMVVNGQPYLSHGVIPQISKLTPDLKNIIKNKDQD